MGETVLINYMLIVYVVVIKDTTRVRLVNSPGYTGRRLRRYGAVNKGLEGSPTSFGTITLVLHPDPFGV